MAKWKELLATVAPSIGSAIGGPLGGLAVSTALEALGVSSDGGEKALKAKLADLSPADYVKLKEADLTYQSRLAELDVEETKAYLADRADARNMRLHSGRWTADILAYLTVFGFFAVIGSFFWFGFELDEDVKDPLLILIGVLGAAFKDIYQFFFGSSRGSKEKTGVISQMNEGKKNV